VPIEEEEEKEEEEEEEEFWATKKPRLILSFKASSIL
jgi:hypothetical protein